MPRPPAFDDGPPAEPPPSHPAVGQPLDARSPDSVSGTSHTPGRSGRPAAVGPSIEGYELREELHRGGQGVVYRAIQLGTKREVALKVLLEGPYASETARRRFEREIELAATLRDPNIVTILDSGLSLGRYYFAMEYIHGERLDRYIAKHRLPLQTALELFEKICNAVNYAHQRGVIHRDLKPPNILVDEQGEPHVLDFGLAKHIPSGSEDSTIQLLSTSGQILGTVAYMSPEQAAGSQDVDVRSDVYSMGVIFYEALLGQPPYCVSGPLGEVLTRIAHDDPASPRSVALKSPARPRVDDDLSTILLKALEKEPDRRYQTAAALGRDLRHWLDGDPLDAKRSSGLYMLRKTLRRYRLQAVMAGAVLLMLVGFLITFAVLFAQQREATQRASELTLQARAAAQERQKALDDSVLAEEQLRRALIRQHIQRGDLALERDELIEARDSYWNAYDLGDDPAAVWALRKYYLQTANVATSLIGGATHRLAQLSPDGRVSAVCTTPDSIALERVGTGATLGWVPTPGPVQLLDLRDDGTLAAGGTNWLEVWPAGALRPSVVVRLPENLPNVRDPLEPQALYVVGDGRSLLVVGRKQVALFRGPEGQVISHLYLQEPVSGPCDYAPNLRQVAVTTRAGVELITVGDARLASQIVWHSSTAPRAVRFAGRDRLAILSVDGPAGAATARSTIYVATIAELVRDEWTRFLDLDGAWDLLDLDFDQHTATLATHDGRLAIYRAGQPASLWNAKGARIVDIHYQASDQVLLTLDDQNTVTEWMAPERVEQRRLVQVRTPQTWAASADGSVVLMGFPRRRVMAYVPSSHARPYTLLAPYLLGGGDAPALSISADGNRAAIIEGTTLRFVDVRSSRNVALAWPPADKLTPTNQVALSADGQLVALLTRSNSGDQQRVEFLPWQTTEEAAETARPAPCDFVGAEIRALAFLPDTHELLVARSNGQIFRLDSAATTAAVKLTPWLELDAPVHALAFSVLGDYVAVACEDDTIRLIRIADPTEPRRIPVGGTVDSLSFNPRNNLLLVRTADGTVRLFDPDTDEAITEWRLPIKDGAALAVWAGEADAMLVGYPDGVYEHRYQRADDLIERNRPFAWQREVTRRLADSGFTAAWDAASALHALAPQRAESAQIAVLAASLHRPQEFPSTEWSDSVLRDAAPYTWVRLGHAAYAGERFLLAREWLRRGMTLAGGKVDASTTWRLAECDYLAGDYAGAAAGLSAALRQPDLDRGLVATIRLQRVAALVLAGRVPEARLAAAQIARQPGIPQGLSRDEQTRRLVAQSAASTIARFVAGLESDTPLATGWETLLTALGQTAFALEFQDDVHFFRGELARQRGDLAEAAVQYQRCIDVSRDPWPANWSRFRLAQLAANPIRTNEVAQ